MGNKCQGKAGIFIFHEGDGDLVCQCLMTVILYVNALLCLIYFLQITKIFHIILDGYGCLTEPIMTFQKV